MKRNKNAGFSLTELIVVIAIITVIASLLAPQYIKYIEKARQTSDLTDMEKISDVLTAAYSEGGLGTDGKAEIYVFPKSTGEPSHCDDVLETALSGSGIDVSLLRVKSTKAPWKDGYTVVIDLESGKVSVVVDEKNFDYKNYVPKSG